MTIKETIARLIDQDIYTNASTMVQDLTNEGSHWVDDLVPCLVSDDWEEPVRESLQDITPAGLLDVAELLATELVTKTGYVVGPDDVDTMDVDSLDRQPIIDLIDEDDRWQEVADHLDIDPYVREALQHWLVSDYLAEALEDVGALVARDVLGFSIWGRTECGQGLEYDGDLRKVAELIEARLAEALNR